MNTQTLNQTHHVTTGQVVSTNLYGLGRGVIYSIHGDQRTGTVRSARGVATMDIAFDCGSLTHDLPEDILHGVQWQVHDEVLSPEETAAIVRYAEEETRRAAEEKERTKNKYRADMEKMKTAPEYAHLSQERNGAVQVTGNIRRELKKTFPGVKFSVTKRSYDAVTVKWTDGVTEERVKDITDKYQDSYFDGMQDMSVSCSYPFNEVYGGVGYVFTERKYSDEMKEKAISAFIKKIGNAFHEENISLERYNRGELWRIGGKLLSHGYGVQAEINKILSEME